MIVELTPRPPSSPNQNLSTIPEDTAEKVFSTPCPSQKQLIST